MKGKNILKRLKFVLYISLLTLLIVFILIGVNIYRYSLYSPSGKADAAIILGAAVWNGEPSPVFAERIKHAIHLYSNNRVNYLIFTGGVGIRDNLSEAEVGKKYAIDHGVNPDHIFVDPDSRITYQNLVNAKEIAYSIEASSYLIVSDPLHMKRSMMMAEDLGMNVFPSPTSTTKYETWRSKLPFLIREIYFYIHYHVRTALGIWNY